MIYTIKSTVRKKRPVKIVLDDIELTQVFYLDRRRRVYRRYATHPNGALVIDEALKMVVTEEHRYHHRQNIRIFRLPWMYR